MLIDRYFELIEAQLDNNPVVGQWKMAPEPRGRSLGYLRGDVELIDGSRLHFREYVDVAHNIQRITYAYQYMDSTYRLIFRYDNTDHHPHIPTQSPPQTCRQRRNHRPRHCPHPGRRAGRDPAGDGDRVIERQCELVYVS